MRTTFEESTLPQLFHLWSIASHQKGRRADEIREKLMIEFMRRDHAGWLKWRKCHDKRADHPSYFIKEAVA